MELLPQLRTKIFIIKPLSPVPSPPLGRGESHPDGVAGCVGFLLRGRAVYVLMFCFIISKTESMLFWTSEFVNLMMVYPMFSKRLVLPMSSSVCCSVKWYSPSTSMISLWSKQIKSAIKSRTACCLLNFTPNCSFLKYCHNTCSASVGAFLLERAKPLMSPYLSGHVVL